MIIYPYCSECRIITFCLLLRERKKAKSRCVEVSTPKINKKCGELDTQAAADTDPPSILTLSIKQHKCQKKTKLDTLAMPRGIPLSIILMRT
jgi:hypothetical protein